MGIREYKKGEHPAGFIGFRVTALLDDDYKQEYFSTRNAEYQNENCFYYKRQHLRAQIKDAEWMAESAWYQYRRFVTQDHPTTKPYRGVGVHSLRTIFFVNRRGNWEPCFEINRGAGRAPYKVTFKQRTFSEAWFKAVNTWAETHEVLSEDRDRVLANPPKPEQFRELRRQMNSEGKDIPVSALESVFREQRDQLVAARLLKAQDQNKSGLTETARGHSANVDAVQAEMAAWFKSARTRESSEDCN